MDHLSHSWYRLLFFNSKFYCGAKLTVYKIYISNLLLWSNRNSVIETVTWRCSWKRYCYKFHKIHKKNLCQSLFFNKVADQACNFIKKRLWHRCFPVNFAKFLKTSFYRTPPDDWFLKKGIAKRSRLTLLIEL